MSTITWLHISDLHFRASQAYDINVILQELLHDVAKCIGQHNLRPDFIAVTGDVAFSGKSAEYDLARQFLDDLLQIVGLDKERLFPVPGNHDVDRELVLQEAQNIGDSLVSRESVNAILASRSECQQMFARFGGYATFVNDYLGRYLQFDHKHYFYVRTLDLAGRQVTLLGLNSAWLSASDQDKIKGLVIGEHQARTALAQTGQADLRIALLHHPFDQMREFDRNDVQPVLCAGCDFVLHGHGHRTNLSHLKDPDVEAMIIAAGACYDTRRRPNLYNFVQLDLVTGIGEVYLRRYSDLQGGFWTRDTLTYRNASTGQYSFRFPTKKLETGPGTLQPGQTILNGKYHVLKCIDEGGMASVWLAEEPQFGGRRVAIKKPLLGVGHSQELERRFQQEVDLMPQLKGVSNIMQAYTLEHLGDGTPLLVMEYVEGGSLADLIAKNRDGLPIEQAFKITQNVLQALTGFHQLSDTPVHRDIKPSNILLDRQRGALLCDFGLAQLPGKSARSELKAKPHPGTPLYMAPEQEHSTILLTSAADLYAVGCVLFEMLTGKHYKWMTRGTKASEIRPEVPTWLDEVLAKALAENPSSRYQSAEEMAKALESPASWPSGYIVDNEYEIVAKIATTGYCEIYQAKELRYARETVAIKRLKPDKLIEQEGLDLKEAHERFEREIVILRHIEHQCVLRLLDDGGRIEKGDRYFVTHFADKGSLSDYLQTKPGNRLKPDEGLEIAEAICQATGIIHQLGIIHRDIKPGNIFLFSGPEGYTVKLADFSIAKVPETWFVNETITQTDVFLGTYPYSAPEQFASELDNPRSDLYAWAVVFFEMLTGESLGQILTGETNKVSFLTLLQHYRSSGDDELPASFFTDRGIPQELVAILQKALRRDPESRYQSAEELQKDLIDAQRILTNSDAKAEAHYRLGMERWENGDLQGAIEQLGQIPQAAEDFNKAQSALAKIHNELGNRHFKKLRFIRAIKHWAESDRRQRTTKESH